MKHLFYLIILILLPISIYSQIEDITRLPVQNPSQSIKESAPIWISENEIMIFYVSPTLDTIYSTKSNDRGINWEEPKVLQLIELGTSQDLLYLTSLGSNTGRILLAWSVRGESMKLIFSDDNAESWSEPLSILGGSTIPGIYKNSEYLNLTQLETGELVLCFSSGTGAFYRLSSDGGLTWSEDAYDFPGVVQVKPVRELSIHSIGIDSLLGVFHLANGGGINHRISTDGGTTWGDTVRVVNGVLNETRPRLSKSYDGTLWLVYLVENESGFENYKQDDIYLLKSTDRGISWIEEERFTKYIGNDELINISGRDQKILFSFATERFANYHQIGFAILGETEEQSTPPKVLDFTTGSANNQTKTFTLNATVIDDEKVNDVKVAIESSEDVITLYDDGMHEDSDSADNIYGNTIDFFNPSNATNLSFNVNKIEMPISNNGILAAVNVSTSSDAQIIADDINNYEITLDTTVSYALGSGGKFAEGVFLFSGGFFLSGISNGNLWANGVGPSSLVQDYLPGTIASNPEDPLFNFYVVEKDDIPFGSAWIKWKDAVSLGAEFYDGDNDGIYNPADKNWNGTWDEDEDMPFILGDLTAWCVYNDGVPSNMRRWNTVAPQGIEIRQTVFASSLPELENVIFIKYNLLNNGSVNNKMDSVYFGIWEDGDLGEYSDDVVGCDTLLNSGLYYNNDSDYVYGEDCPSFFTSLLQGPVIDALHIGDTATINYGIIIGSETIPDAKNLNMNSHTFMIRADPNLPSPRNEIEARNYMLAKDRIGNTLDPCTFPYCEVRGGVNCSEVNPLFWASGDPVTDIGWINLSYGDPRNLVNTGPFKLEQNIPQEIIVAYVMGRGTDYFNSITVARENVQRVIQEYESNFASMTYVSPPPTDPITNYILYHNYPNPFNPTTTIRYELPEDGLVTIKLYDILGQEVTTILNEFKKADRYEINFNAVGLASGVYIYRMKVNDFIESKKMLLIK